MTEPLHLGETTGPTVESLQKEIQLLKDRHEFEVRDLQHKIGSLTVLAESRLKGLELANAEAQSLQRTHADMARRLGAAMRELEVLRSQKNA